MNSSRKKVLAAGMSSVVALFPLIGAANQLTEAVKQLSILGTFSPDCSALTQSTTWGSVWEVTPDDKVSITIIGSGQPAKFYITQVEALQGNQVKIRREAIGRPELNAITIQKTGAGYKVVQNVDLRTGKVLVKNGVSASDGARMETMQRCGDEREIPRRQQATTEREAAERQAIVDQKRIFNERAAKRRAEFASAIDAPFQSPPFEEFFANPFPFKGKYVSYQADFQNMLSATEAIFTRDNGKSFVVRNVPEGKLRRPGSTIVAGKVLGNSPVMGGVQVPLLDYSNIFICAAGDCEDYFGRK